MHALFVRIRDDEGNPMPGVTIGDNGAKGGLPGVDNGTIAFDHVRVPRENLLDKFGGIDETNFTNTSTVLTTGGATNVKSVNQIVKGGINYRF